jgi:hypothetical protein
VLQFEESSGISKVFSEEYADGENKLQQRKIALVAGFKIVGFPNQTSNNGPLPDQNLATESLSKYNADFSIQTNTGACPAISLAAGEEGQAAVGVVTYQDIKNFVVYQQDRLGWLVGSYILCGAGQMYPYCAGSLEVKA